MTVRLHRKTAPVALWLSLVCMGVASAQSDSNLPMTPSIPNPGAPYSQQGGNFGSPGPQSVSAPNNMGTDVISANRRNSKAARKSGIMPLTASRWTAGANSFGVANEPAWQQMNPSLQTDTGKAWSPGVEGFGISPQPGGIWVVSSAASRGEESATESAGWEMIQRRRGNSSVAMNPSNPAVLTQRTNPAAPGNLTSGMFESRSQDASSPGSSRGVPSQRTDPTAFGNPPLGMYQSTSEDASSPGTLGGPLNRLADSTTMAPWRSARLTQEYSFQKANSSITANSFLVGQSFGSPSNRKGAPAITRELKSSLLHRTGPGYARGLGSLGGSSMSRLSSRSVGSYGYVSRSMGAGRATRGQTSERRRLRGSSRGSFSNGSDEQHDNSHSIPNTELTHGGLEGESGKQKQRVGLGGFESKRSNRDAGNGRRPAGKSRSSHGLNTHLLE
jgi:hypothetical protein